MTLVRFRNSRHPIPIYNIPIYIYIGNYRAFMVAIFLEFPYSPPLVVPRGKNGKGGKEAVARKQCRLKPKWPVTLDPEIA